MKYIKKPVVIEAVKFDATYASIKELVGLGLEDFTWNPVNKTLHIKTLEGLMRADYGDFIIRGVQNEFYPCKPDIFEETYEALED